MTTTILKDQQGRKAWCMKWHLSALNITIGIAHRLNLKQKKRGSSYNKRLRKKINYMANGRKNKPKMYEELQGRCSMCGKEFKQSAMQLHHVLPLERFPELGSSKDNLLLICPECHNEIHRNPWRNIRLMQEKADELGINLDERYNRA